jgi:katanin p60 ATPase-containing subunit A1
MKKDIIAEEAAVRRIQGVLDEILSKLDSTPPDPIREEEPPIADAPLWSRKGDDDDNDDLPVIQAPERRPIVYNPKVRRNQPVGGRVGIQRGGIPQRGVKQASARDGQRGIANKANRPAPPQKVNAAIAKKPVDKPVLDPSTNPLVQQIIDMGILVREPNVQWESIAGLTSVKRLLRQNLVILPMRPDICKGLLAPWKSVLFYGPPGTGKTFLAKAVATECKRTFFNITSATITSRFLGESEKLVSHLFDLAEQMAPSTIFFDEIDSIASQRGTGHEHEASRKMKAQLLTRLEGIDGALENSGIFVLAATNFPWHLDEALLRRFQKRIYIPLPDLEGRKQILKMSISDLIDDDFELDLYAQKLEGYSCADITNLCRDAAQAVFNKQTSNLDTQAWLNMPLEQARVVITNQDFERAISLRKSSVDKETIKMYEEWRRSKGAE